MWILIVLGLLWAAWVTFEILGLMSRLDSARARTEVMRSEFAREVVKLRHEIDETQRSIS